MRTYVAKTKGDVNGRAYREFMAHVRGEELREGVMELQKISVHFFLTFLSRQRSDALHEDFKSQSRLCGFGEIAYTFVGRVETFEKDVAIVDAKLGMSGGVYAMDDKAEEGAAEARRMVRVSRLRAKAAKLYEDDFKHFDYSLDNT